MGGSRLLALLVTAASVLVIAGCGSEGDPEELTGMTRQPQTEVSALSLPNENPNSENPEGLLKGSDDGLMIVYFGFTHCPDVCPTSLADLRLALEDLDEEDRERIEVAMVTVDPERDTGEVLNGYLGHFFEESQFSSLRTTDKEQLEKVEKRFGASHRIGKPDDEGRYDVDHTALLYAVDSNGIVRVEWPFATPPQDMNSDIRKLLSGDADSSNS